MPVDQGQIVQLYFNTGTGKQEIHPGIVVSSNQMHHGQDGFLAVMITHNKASDEFTFDLNPKGINKTTKGLGGDFSQARVHMIGWFLESQIVPEGNFNRLKKEYIKPLLDQIAINVFGLDSNDY